MKKIIAPLFIAILFFSCSSDEVKSSENYIEKFTIEGVKPIQIFIKHDQNLIQVLTFQGNQEILSNAIPKIKVSDNATLSANGKDWTAKDFSYTVVAENGEKRSYSVQFTIAYNKYSFETWDLSNDGYYVPSEQNSIWTSGNAGISMALAGLKIDSKDPENYPTKKTSEGYIGNAAVMETIKGGLVVGRNIPIISGNFFLGNFNVAKAITDELTATEVGSIYPAKPKRVTGFYKYKEGPGDFNNKGTPEHGRRDSCNLHISFYQGDSPSSGNDTILTVRDIDSYNSELVIADAILADCSETSGDGFHEFALDFGNYREEPDFENHYYKIAITFAASRGGATYEGKIGSKLVVDEVKIEDY